MQRSGIRDRPLPTPNFLILIEPRDYIYAKPREQQGSLLCGSRIPLRCIRATCYLIESLSSTAGCGKPHVRWCGMYGRNPVTSPDRGYIALYRIYQVILY